MFILQTWLNYVDIWHYLLGYIQLSRWQMSEVVRSWALCFASNVEAIKAFDQLLEDPLLGVQYLGGCLASTKALDSKEVWIPLCTDQTAFTA